MMKRWLAIVLLVVGCIVCSSGCSGRGKGAKATDEGIGAMGGHGIDEQALSERPETPDIITSVTFDNVLFEYDSAQVSPKERKKIEDVAAYLKDNSGTSVIIEGHCDERGSREYNMALGERRALAVRAYLIGLGIDGSSIQTKSYGEEDPLNLGHDEDSWRVNRRGEFILFE